MQKNRWTVKSCQRISKGRCNFSTRLILPFMHIEVHSQLLGPSLLWQWSERGAAVVITQEDAVSDQWITEIRSVQQGKKEEGRAAAEKVWVADANKKDRWSAARLGPGTHSFLEPRPASASFQCYYLSKIRGNRGMTHDKCKPILLTISLLQLRCEKI